MSTHHLPAGHIPRNHSAPETEAALLPDNPHEGELEQQLQQKLSEIDRLKLHLADAELEFRRRLHETEEKALIDRAEQQCEIENLKLTIEKIKTDKGLASFMNPAAPAPASSAAATAADPPNVAAMFDSTLATLLKYETQHKQQGEEMAALKAELARMQQVQQGEMAAQKAELARLQAALTVLEQAAQQPKPEQDLVATLEQKVARLLTQDDQRQAALEALEQRIDAQLAEQTTRLAQQEQGVAHLVEQAGQRNRLAQEQQAVQLQQQQEKIAQLEAELRHYSNAHLLALSRFDDLYQQVQQSKTDAALLITQQFGQALDGWRAVQAMLALGATEFIHFLFQFALGRGPLEHELIHFGQELEQGTERMAIIELLFGCDEHKMWRAANPNLPIPASPGATTSAAAPSAPAVASGQTQTGAIEALLFAQG